MKPSEFNDLLKSAGPPARTGEYWAAFPKKVTAKIHWQSQTAAQPPAPRLRRPGLSAWAFGLAAACVLVGFVIGFWRGQSSAVSDRQLAQAQKYYQEIAALFPNQLQAIVFDANTPRMVLAEKADVPDSPPYYVKICGPDGCRSYVTFSGQQVEVNGEQCEVLADARGRLLLVGKHAVWSESNPSGPVRVTARPLSAAL